MSDAMPPFSDKAAQETLLRRMGTDLAEARARLARFEFEAMLRDLRGPDPFGAPARFGARPGHRAGGGPAAARKHETASAPPPLQVPLGSIAWSSDATRLAVLGVHCPDLPDAVLAAALTTVLGQHHRRPFARLVFVCDSFRPVVFLGRYGFATHVLGGESVADAGPWLARRFAISQIRALENAALLWTATG